MFVFDNRQLVYFMSNKIVLKILFNFMLFRNLFEISFYLVVSFKRFGRRFVFVIVMDLSLLIWILGSNRIPTANCVVNPHTGPLHPLNAFIVHLYQLIAFRLRYSSIQLILRGMCSLGALLHSIVEGMRCGFDLDNLWIGTSLKVTFLRRVIGQVLNSPS